MRVLFLLVLLGCSTASVVLAEEAESPGRQSFDSVLALEGLVLSPGAVFEDAKSSALARTLVGQLGAQGRPSEGRSVAVLSDAGRWVRIRPDQVEEATLSVWMLPLASDRFVKGALYLEGLDQASVWLNGRKLAISDGSVELALARGSHDLWIVHGGADKDQHPALSFAGEQAHDQLRLAFDAPARVTPEQLTNAETVSGLTVSPDGRWLALRWSGRDELADLDLARLDIHDRSSGEVVRSWTDDLPGSLAWSPDSKTLAWQQGMNLWVQVQGQAPRLLLSKHEHLGAWHWHPDGRSLIFAWTEPEKDASEQRRRVRSLEDRWDNFRDNRQLYQVDLASGLIRPLTSGDTSINLLDIHPQGDRLLLSERIIDYTQPPHSLWRLVELDMSDLSRREIGQYRMLNGALFADQGYWLMAGPGLAGADGATTGPELTANEYDTQLYRLSADGTSARSVSRDFDPAISQVHRLPDGDLLLSAVRGEGVMVARFDHQRERFVEIETGLEVIEEFVASEGRRVQLAVRGSDANRPQRVIWIDLARDRPETIVDTRDRAYAGVEFGPVEPWSFVNRDGVTIDGRYYLPPDFDGEQTWPLIVYYYGGTTPVGRAFTGRYPFNLWAARGYVVYVLQPRGTIGYGQEISALHVNAWGRYTADDIIEGSERFLAAHDFVSADAVANIGASYGGFMTMYLATRTDMFTASVSHAGISSLTSYWGEGWWGYGYSGIASRDSFPWNNPELYVEQSPIYSADQITTPLLLLTGDSDTNVPPGESDTMFTALKLLGRDVELIEFPGEDHWILDREKRYVWWDTMLAWFDKHLKDQPEWWNHLYPES